MIEGILLEGVDYSGKTTVAKELDQHLQYTPLQTSYHKEYLTDNDQVQHYVEKGLNEDPGPLQDWYFTKATIVDHHQYTPSTPSPFFLMDRNWLSMVGHTQYFYDEGNVLQLSKQLQNEHNSFRENVYLTCSLKEKRRRLSKEPPTSPFDQYLSENPQIHQEYDKFFKSLLPRHKETWHIIDTTNKSLCEVVNTILDTIDLTPTLRKKTREVARCKT